MITYGNSKKEDDVNIDILLNMIGQYGITVYNQFVPVT